MDPTHNITFGWFGSRSIQLSIPLHGTHTNSVPISPEFYTFWNNYMKPYIYDILFVVFQQNRLSRVTIDNKVSFVMNAQIK